jgi:hypothetical protein
MSLPEESPERQFLANWGLADADWEATFEARIESYLDAVRARLAAPGGFDRYVELAESRRRRFARLPLNEFELLLPETNIPANAPLLRMDADGDVVNQ